MIDIKKLMFLIDDYASSNKEEIEQKKELMIEYIRSFNDPNLKLYSYYDQNQNRTTDKTKAKSALFIVE